MAGTGANGIVLVITYVFLIICFCLYILYTYDIGLFPLGILSMQTLSYSVTSQDCPSALHSFWQIDQIYFFDCSG